MENWNKILKWIRKNTSTWGCCNRHCGIAFNQRTQYLDSTFLSLTIYPCLQKWADRSSEFAMRVGNVSENSND